MRSFIKYSFLISLVFGLNTYYDGPEDEAGDKSAIQYSYMNGNRINLYFKNTTELSDWSPLGPLYNVSTWPDNSSGESMLDGIALLVGAKTYILNDGDPTTVDTQIIDQEDDIEDNEGNLHEIYFVQTSYREGMDKSELIEINWGFYPVFGYFNAFQDHPAMSNDENTWPDAWPSYGTTTKWPGEWDGRFGRGIQYADLETYFVVNDAQDQEYLQNNLPFKYFPIEGATIQSGATYQAGLPWGGLGIRVETRGFQWNNPLVRDALFWEYNISNISDYDITEVAFGYWVDNGIGSDISDEYGFFDTLEDLSYTWDDDQESYDGDATGIMGFAFLESPGRDYNGLDDDEDGLIDEKRDNPAGSYANGCWSGDEDCDWRTSVDENGPCINVSCNCIEVNDDVGLDGVGPYDINYTGPDEGECNGRPDCVEGVGCEPNFGETDVSESDMIGLTSFQLFQVPETGSADNLASFPDEPWFGNDEVLYNTKMVNPDNPFTPYENESPANLIEVFASASFALDKGRTERISMAEIHSFDEITGPPSNTQASVPALFALKETVQLIYETDYRFAVPPNIPTLTAEAGDGHVVLSWNDIAEKSVDRFLPEDLQEDFEGYKLYRSTDSAFEDSQIITDGYGDALFFNPIFQCDKVNEYSGFATSTPVSGTSYYLGDNTGIEHKFIDYNVDNGRKYYYALVAYDHGLQPDVYAELESGIPPTENKALIKKDPNSDYIIATGPNVAIVIPRAPSAGFIDPSFDSNKELSGTGTIDIEIYSQGLVEDNQNYILTFDNDTDNENYLVTSGVRVYKEEEYCDGIECLDLDNESDCINQYGCDWSGDLCVDYPCSDEETSSDCNQEAGCYWNDGLSNGTWSYNASANIFSFQSDSFFNNSTGSIDQNNSEIIIYNTEIAPYDCYKFHFTLTDDTNEGERTYGISTIGRFGNSECDGNEILGTCITETVGVFNEDNCDGTWITYLEEYDITEFKLLSSNNFTSGDFILQRSEFCDINNFGQDYCNEISNQNECNLDVACTWNDLRLLYHETGQTSGKLVFRENSDPLYSYWTINPDETFTTDVIDGLVFSITNPEFAFTDWTSWGWMHTDNHTLVDEPTITINETLMRVRPSTCQIRFTDEMHEARRIYIFSTQSPGDVSNNPCYDDGNFIEGCIDFYEVNDETGTDIGGASTPILYTNCSDLTDEDSCDDMELLGHNLCTWSSDTCSGSSPDVYSKEVLLNFYVYNELDGSELDLLVVDQNNNGQYDMLADKVLVGHAEIETINIIVGPTVEEITELVWKGTNFSIEFNEEPGPGDIFSIKYSDLPFLNTDKVYVHTSAPNTVDMNLHDFDLNRIKVVPNPYVGSNLMEEALSNQQSIERKIMFTHLPAQCKISIFTVSGVLVDEIDVNNNNDNGMAYWDLLSNEGLEVAAGMYIYHVQSKINSKYKMGKFAIIK